MGKYMKKGKITGDVAVMEVPQSALGVRTRAKTLARQQSPELSYLQLRSRRLEKPQFPPPSPTKTERMEKQKHCNRGVGHTQSERAGSRLRVCSGNSVPACSASLSRSKKVELEEEEAEAEKCAGKLGSRSSTPIQRAKGGAIGTKFDDFGVEASFGENNLEFDGIGRQLNHFGDVGSLDDNVESFLTHDGGNGRDLYGTTEQKREPSTGFTFAEVGCIRTRNKVTSCHFSSDGKFLASAGHDRKVVLWSMDTIGTENTPEEHKHVITDVRLRPNSTQLATASFDGSVRLWDAANVVLWNMDTIGTENTPEERKHVITDVRFRPNSTQLATASFDGSVRLWDAANPNHCLNVYSGHSSHITSLDFHPRKNDLFCFCDSNNEIRYWKINPFSCAHISRGGTVHVRFQPRVGQLLAAVSEQVVNFFDVDNDRIVQTFQAHSGVAVDYICWDASGKLLACVSPDSVKVWSITSGDCVHELISSNGNQFHSCVFHPSYCELLVIGGTQAIELWNMADNRSMTVPAHENIISALATSVSGMVASAGLDCSVKLWK